MKKFISIALSALILFLFFSYKLTEIPRGLTIDEAAFGYNANLISQTLRDETGRTLPIFVLSIKGRDWRQPVTQYLDVIYFKLFGASIYNLRVTSVLIIVASTILIFYLGQLMVNKVYGIFVSVVFATTPIIMIHSHLGLDNIAPLPFILFWFIFLVLHEKKRDTNLLILSAISLGIGFYSYKGMRSFSSIWSILTGIYLSLPYLTKMNKKGLSKIIKPVLTFTVSILPFYIVIPYLEFKFAGAVLGQSNIGKTTIYQFFSSYLSSFDPSFLFVTGDELPHHSTLKHGMLLLASLPFFVTGLTRIKKKNKKFMFIVFCLFLGPLFFGFPGSYHRASRLIAIVPLYSLVAGFGSYHLFKGKASEKLLFIIFGGLIILNYSDFLNYYWNSYAKDYEHIFYPTTTEKAYQLLENESEKLNLVPIISTEIAQKEETLNDYPMKFLRSTHFLYIPQTWMEGNKFPENGLLMTFNKDLENFQKLDFNIGNYYFFKKKQ